MLNFKTLNLYLRYFTFFFYYLFIYFIYLFYFYFFFFVTISSFSTQITIFFVLYCFVAVKLASIRSYNLVLAARNASKRMIREHGLVNLFFDKIMVCFGFFRTQHGFAHL